MAELIVSPQLWKEGRGESNYRGWGVGLLQSGYCNGFAQSLSIDICKQLPLMECRQNEAAVHLLALTPL